MHDYHRDYLDGLIELSQTLNTNLEGVKVWMSAQHLHNELFLERIGNLEKEVKELKEKNERSFR